MMLGRQGWRIGVTVALAGALGCTAFTPPLTAPEHGGASWGELTSPHFVLTTDLAGAEAAAALTEFETTFTAIEDVAFAAEREPRTQIRIVLFQREKDYASFAPKGSAGYFTSHLPNDLDAVPTMVMYGDLVNATRLTFQHELTHLFVRFSLGAVPRWLDEGLAQYFSTFELEDKSAIIGKTLPTCGLGINTPNWRADRVGAFDRVLIPVAYVPSVAEILAGGGAEFNAVDVEGERTVDAARKQTAYYFGAWGLVHMFYSTPEYRDRFTRMLESIRRGAAWGDAWGENFGSAQGMETDFREHLYRTEKVEVQTLKTAYTPRPMTSSNQRRELSAADVHMLWARLRPWNGSTRERARADVDTARSLDPSSPEIQFWSGLFHIADQRKDLAYAELTKALEQRPNDARYLMAMSMADPSGQKLEEVMQRLSKVAVSSRALDHVARWHAASNRAEEGLRFAARAVKADPTCWRCYATAAGMFFAKQQFDEAVVAQERALRLLPDGVKVPRLGDDLRRYVEAQRAARRHPDRPLLP